jgi:hypothetical protein
MREIFHGRFISRAPDLQIDFRDGYRTSWQTSFGAIPPGIVVANLKKWGCDHCASDPDDTGGILLSNRPLRPTGGVAPGALGEQAPVHPQILDIAPTVLKIVGVDPPERLDGKPLETGPL